MNPWLHPQGPESSQTYWARRAGAVVVLVVVVGLLIWLLSSVLGRGATAPGVAAAPSSSASSSASAPASGATPSATSSVSATPTPSVAPTSSHTTPTPSSPTPKTCTVDDLRLSIRGAHQVKSGATTTYRILVLNTAEVACAVDLGKQPIAFTITSGIDQIWSSTDCPKMVPTGTLRIKPGETRVFPLTWTTQRSSSGCTLSKQQLKGGTYWAKTTLAQQSASFRTVLYL